ncbi:hypothetical protein CKAH01_14493 [Colletotrichum kahawae]|uniref:Uncharacterized protein n=1 Tax=Colletotrichum kahawae TaxID=34407 RepID=A0AAD9YMB6_COLKA|nr:hypothetical protein CKAH01_14493 [Colletotrichum kahawae]
MSNLVRCLSMPSLCIPHAHVDVRCAADNRDKGWDAVLPISYVNGWRSSLPRPPVKPASFQSFLACHVIPNRPSSETDKDGFVPTVCSKASSRTRQSDKGTSTTCHGCRDARDDALERSTRSPTLPHRVPQPVRSCWLSMQDGDADGNAVLNAATRATLARLGSAQPSPLTAPQHQHGRMRSNQQKGEERGSCKEGNPPASSEATSCCSRLLASTMLMTIHTMRRPCPSPERPAFDLISKPMLKFDTGVGIRRRTYLPTYGYRTQPHTTRYGDGDLHLAYDALGVRCLSSTGPELYIAFNDIPAAIHPDIGHFRLALTSQLCCASLPERLDCAATLVRQPPATPREPSDLTSRRPCVARKTFSSVRACVQTIELCDRPFITTALMTCEESTTQSQSAGVHDPWLYSTRTAAFPLPAIAAGSSRHLTTFGLDNTIGAPDSGVGTNTKNDLAHFSRRQGLLRLRWLLEGLALRSSPKTVKTAMDYQEHCHVDKPNGQKASRAATPSFRPLQDRRTSIGLATNRASPLAPVVPRRNHEKATSWLRHSVAEAVARSLKRFPPVRESKPSIRIRKQRPHLAVTRRSHSQTLSSHRSAHIGSMQPARGDSGGGHDGDASGKGPARQHAALRIRTLVMGVLEIASSIRRAALDGASALDCSARTVPTCGLCAFPGWPGRLGRCCGSVHQNAATSPSLETEEAGTDSSRRLASSGLLRVSWNDKQPHPWLSRMATT